ncbi:matrixin family metalloprotease [Lactobacillus sp. XV13L]|nr:matrixin family metalloprotease [Lactobacillus sp. XV13L]
MKKLRRFLFKLTFALIAALALNDYWAPSANSITPTGSGQIVLARKTKKRHRTPVYKNLRWRKPQATVYIDLADNHDLIAATSDAIKTWNDTGAFTFKKTKNKKKADITIEQAYRPNFNYAGYTWFNFYLKNNVLFRARTQLNIYYLQNFADYDYDYTRVVNTVEHELGHAVGLKHRNDLSVMYPIGSYYPIQSSDVKRLKKLYNEK